MLQPRRVFPGAGRTVIWLAAACALWSQPAAGTMAPRVNVEILGEAQPAEAGMIFNGTFRVTAEFAALLENFEAPPNPCYETLSLQAPPFAELADEEWLDIPFSVLAQDPNCGPLTLAFDLDGSHFDFSWDLSPESFAQGSDDQPLLLVAAVSEGGPTPAKGGLAAPTAVAGETVPLPDGVAPHAHVTADKAGRNIRVHGRIVYTRKDNQELGADGSSVYVYDGPRLFAQVATDANGYFDVNFTWFPCGICGSLVNPNLVVKFSSENTAASVQNSANKRLRWVTKTWSGYGGNNLDVGVWTPPDAHMAYLHALTVLTRCWRIALSDGGINAAQVKCTYPNPDKTSGPFYWYAGNRIFMNESRIWLEVTLGHEYGHHLVSHYAAGSGTNYCNGVCDGASGCGHCTWCVEADIDAWNEGFPTFLADSLRRRHQALYGYGFLDQLAFENLALCSESGVLDDPAGNEGAFVACLADIEDSNNEDDTLNAAVSGWRDSLNLGSDEIWTVALQDLPSTPLQFLNAFKARFPQHTNTLWETAKNNGFEPDVQAPGAPAWFASTSHALAIPSSDGTITVTWPDAPDDFAGIAGYSLRATLNAPAMPTASSTVGDVNTFTTFHLPAGTWYLTIRAVDRAGRWSGAYATAGPFVIQVPQPADLAAVALPGWAYPVVPHPAPDAVLGSVPAPTGLSAGNQTWWNFGVQNVGGTSTSGTLYQELYVDGVYRDYGTITNPFQVGPGGTMGFLNYGPLDLAGGRHTFGAWADGRETMAENNESNNLWAKQWTWEPNAFPPALRRVRAAPPWRTAGWEALGVPSSGWNLDGLKVTANAGFYGVWIHALDNLQDYDLELHSPTRGGDMGFDTWLAWSQRLGGQLDAVVWNHTAARDQAYDVGVVNYSSGTTDYAIEYVAGVPLGFGTMAALTLPQDKMMLLHTVTVGTGQTGPVSVSLLSAGSGSPLRVSWFDPGLTYSGVTAAPFQMVTGTGGSDRLDLSLPTAGTYCLAIYRDPADGVGPVDFVLEVGPTRPDCTPYPKPGWYAPLVPRPAPDGTLGTLPAPTVLYGDTAPTWFNYAWLNAATVSIPAFDSELLVDGEFMVGMPWTGVPGNTYVARNEPIGQYVRAGRHTASWRLDSGAAVAESNEENNNTGAQWVWDPQVLPAGASVSRGAPSPRTGGWDDLPNPSVAPLWFNCDGVRMVAAPNDENRSGFWQAVAVMPGPSSDVDVRLHETSLSAQDGFGVGLAMSGWGPGASDYVLVNFNRTPARGFDAGVIESAGSEAYAAEHVVSTWAGQNPGGTLGPYQVAADHVLNLHEVWLDPGAYVVHLSSTNGLGDLGVTLHSGQLAYLSKSTAVSGGSSWQAGPGATEPLLFSLDTGRYYCFAVWKVQAEDLPVDAGYTLDFQAVSAVGGPQVPTVARITGAWPNPFNPRLTVSYDLAHEGEAVLSVYGVDGGLVRTLVWDRLAAGRHEVVWNGEDSRGRRAASGVYFVRLQAGTGSGHLTRVTLLK